MSDAAKEILSTHEALVAQRAPVIALLQEVCRYFLPELADSVANADTNNVDPGERIVPPASPYAIYVSETLSSSLYSNSVGMGKRFFVFRDTDEKRNDDPEVKKWYSEVSDQTLKRMQNSNFQVESFGDLLYFCILGTTVVRRRYIDGKGPHYRSIPIFQVCITEDENGDVNGVYYDFEMTAAQCVKKWGDRVSTKIREMAAKPDERNNAVKILHVCRERDPGKVEKKTNENPTGNTADPLKMKYELLYVDVDGQEIIDETGESVFGYAVSRDGRVPGTPYGRSRAMKALPTVRQMNKMLIDMTAATEKGLGPVIFGPAGIDPADVDLRPNTYNPILEEGGGTPTPLIWTPNVDMRPSYEMFREQEQKLRDFFFVDMFLMLESRRTQKTAREVDELAEEKFQTLTPMVARLQTSYFSPQVVGTFEDLAFRNQLDAPPKSLQNSKYSVEYVTRMNALLSAADTAAIMRTVGQIAQILETVAKVPAVGDVLKVDEICRAISFQNGVDADYVMSIVEAQKAKSDREAAQAAAQAAATAVDKIKPIDPLAAPEDGSLMSGSEGLEL